MDLGWLQEELRELKGDVKEMRRDLAAQGSDIAVISAKLESGSEKYKGRAGVWTAAVAALGALAAAMFK